MLYKEGGIYLDLKSSASKPFRDFLKKDDKYILSSWCTGECGRINWDKEVHTGFGEYQQWYIISIPGHPFLKAVINKCIRNILTYKFTKKNVGKVGVLRLTGPIAYTLAIHPLTRTHKSFYRYNTNSFNDLLVYSSFNNFAHQKYTKKKHYTRLTTPIVFETAFKKQALKNIDKYLI